MTTRTVLQIVQDVCDDIGVAKPLALVSASDDLVVQLRGLMRATARAMIRRHDWQNLLIEANFTSLATETQIANIKTTWPDLLRIVPETMHDRDENRPIIGSVNKQAWAAAKASAVTTADFFYRIRGNKLLFFRYADSRPRYLLRVCIAKLVRKRRWHRYI